MVVGQKTSAGPRGSAVSSAPWTANFAAKGFPFAGAAVQDFPASTVRTQTQDLRRSKQRGGIIFFVLFLILYSRFGSIPLTL